LSVDLELIPLLKSSLFEFCFELCKVEGALRDLIGYSLCIKAEEGDFNKGNEG